MHSYSTNYRLEKSLKIAFSTYINDLCNVRISGDRRTKVMVMKERKGWKTGKEQTDFFIIHLNGLLVSLLLINSVNMLQLLLRCKDGFGSISAMPSWVRPWRHLLKNSDRSSRIKKEKICIHFISWNTHKCSQWWGKVKALKFPEDTFDIFRKKGNSLKKISGKSKGEKCSNILNKPH